MSSKRTILIAKEHCLLSKNNQNLSYSTETQSDQYSSINLNQFHKFKDNVRLPDTETITHLSKKIQNDNELKFEKIYANYLGTAAFNDTGFIADFNDLSTKNSNNESKKNDTPKFNESFKSQKMKNELKFQNNKNGEESNKSTLSLHISAYENGNETQNNAFASKSLKSDPSHTASETWYYFRRQQNENLMMPEIMHFKASQKLLNLNAIGRTVSSNIVNMIKTTLFLLIILLLPTICFASIGDKFSYFQDCTGFCRRDFECPAYNFAYTWTTTPCFQCRQKCIFETVQIFEEKGWKIPQFFGKWPFSAFYLNFGPLLFLIQEPASTIFSLMNLFAVYKMHQRICKEVDEEFRMKTVWKGYGWAGMIVWICSALFHSRDFWITEYLDYFAACFLIFYAMFAGISFVFPSLQSSKIGKKVWASIGTLITLFFFGHVYSLLSDFDYGHNMLYCISASVITAAIYLIWFIREVMAGKGRRSLGALFLLITIGLGSALFEVLDFPPIFWIFDAHSLFHATTIPTPLLLAEFAILEAKYEQDLTKSRIGKEY